MPSLPFVSIIVPCRNEAQYIGPCLDSILRTEYPLERLEIIVVDGMSDDGSALILEEYARQHRVVQVLQNSRGTAPAAMNIAIRHARGDVIMRMDAHSRYPTNYAPRLVDWLERTQVDNVGGVCITRPASDRTVARAIAVALAHPFGVGNSHFRIGVSAPRYVDTVPFGCYRRSVFQRIGLFDESLIRNQDDEFNARLVRAGGRILLVPDVTSEYYARESLRKVWRMFWQYGLFKPAVVKRVGAVLSARQLAPAALVLALLLCLAASVMWPVGLIGFGAVLAAYAATMGLAAFSVARRAGWRVGAAMLAVFPTLHFAYGMGYLTGVAHMLRGPTPVLKSADGPLSTSR